MSDSLIIKSEDAGKYELHEELQHVHEINIQVTKSEAKRLQNVWRWFNAYKSAYAEGKRTKGTVLSLVWVFKDIYTAILFKKLHPISDFYYSVGKSVFPIDFVLGSNNTVSVRFRRKPTDESEKFEMLSRLANEGDENAQYNLATLYAKGLGTTQDYSEAIRWYRCSADKNFPEAQYALGWYYSNGIGVEKDKEAALFWLTKAADNGHKESIKMVSDFKK